jgi:hypothetical protein
MTVARRFIAGVRDPWGVGEQGSADGSVGGIAPIASTSLLFLDAHEPPPTPLQASLRDADPMDGQPGDKSPGYDRASLRD